jgi:hypothetical protein
MPIYKTKLKSRREIAAGTMAFHFEKPEGFAYKAGQFADYTLINPSETDAEGNTRGFSLASAPYEDDLMLATRMRDTAFKRVLKNMELDTEFTLDAPYGSFTLVSSDIVADPRASVVQLDMTRVVGGNLAKVMCWYDNEWGFTNQMVREALQDLGSKETPPL